MNLKQITNKAKDKSNFVNLKAFIKFCDEYLNTSKYANRKHFERAY